MAINSISIAYNFNENTKKELKKLLPTLGKNISFNDDIWICSNLRKSSGHNNSSYTLYFTVIPEKYRSVVKIFSLLLIRQGMQLWSIKGDISQLSTFLKYLVEEHNGLELSEVDNHLLFDYRNYIGNSPLKQGTKRAKWSAVKKFINSMNGLGELSVDFNILGTNPFKVNSAERKIDTKYIPDFITNQLDKAFKNDDIPVWQRLVYWLARSIPSRISEITSMEINCLKPYLDNWVIFMPTWKQAGGYKTPQIRRIHLKYEGHGKYLIDLIRKQQEIAIELQKSIEDSKKGLLFTYERKIFHNSAFETKGKIIYRDYGKNKIIIANPANVANVLSALCQRFDIRDEHGDVYKITSHQLRHNGITDRLYSGFRAIEIRDMTGHQGETMLITAYSHIKSNELKERQQLVIDKKDGSASENKVLFKGRILNMEEKIEQRLLSNPRAHKLSKLGICSDITSCKSELFECLSCDDFIPNAEELDMFEEQVHQWSKKVEVFRNHDYMRENAEYNLSLNKKIVSKIKTALNMED